MINPNLLISVDIKDIDSQIEIVKLLFGKDLDKKELDEKVLEIQDILMVFDILGLSYDVQKIEMIVERFGEMDRELSELRKRSSNGDLFKGIFSDKIDKKDFLRFLMNSTTKKHYQEMEEEIGKRDFKKLMSKIDAL